MSTILPDVRLHWTLNPAFDADAPYGPRQQAILGGEAFRRADAQIRRWPGYCPTPLRDLAGLAQAAGVRQILYKQEAHRFGLGSFKALGGAYAVSRLLLRELGQRLGRDDLGIDDLLSGKYRETTQDITVTCATDGNHGRSVA
ncbi:threonine dehydratase [Kerstersia gyiorum]|nr:threonine dehydratase [Kerstersia gyiorum]MCP1822233.1 threonine dehydratase [Kerstersia gyiorum]MCP1825657.1 threonine dehydratase [Kerstersia gyiorum]MCW2449533.1 threonine dehydratase [Kerstersia gyiorum]